MISLNLWKTKHKKALHKMTNAFCYHKVFNVLKTVEALRIILRSGYMTEILK